MLNYYQDVNQQTLQWLSVSKRRHLIFSHVVSCLVFLVKPWSEQRLRKLARPQRSENLPVSTNVTRRNSVSIATTHCTSNAAGFFCPWEVGSRSREWWHTHVGRFERQPLLAVDSNVLRRLLHAKTMQQCSSGGESLVWTGLLRHQTTWQWGQSKFIWLSLTTGGLSSGSIQTAAPGGQVTPGMGFSGWQMLM